MIRQLMQVTLIAGVVFVGTQEALAQRSGASARAAYGQNLSGGPAISPYLYLLNGNSSNIGNNYFTFTQPMQQQQGVNIQQYQQGAATQQQVNALGKNVKQGNFATLRATGNVASRMNYSHYYSGMGGSGGGGSGSRSSGSAGMGGGIGGGGMF